MWPHFPILIIPLWTLNMLWLDSFHHHRLYLWAMEIWQHDMEWVYIQPKRHGCQPYASFDPQTNPSSYSNIKRPGGVHIFDYCYGVYSKLTYLDVSLQQQQRNPLTLVIRQQFFRNSSSQAGGSSEPPLKHLYRWWSRAFGGSSKKGRVGGNIPYFPVVLGFAATGCLGAGLLVVFADPGEGGSNAPSPANAASGWISCPISLFTHMPYHRNTYLHTQVANI